jgi:hypothetical protein
MRSIRERHPFTSPMPLRPGVGRADSRAPLLAALALMVGCAGGTRGCGALEPLPSAPAPFGFPSMQQIAGGMQFRLTPSGLDKAGELLANSLPTSACLAPIAVNLVAAMGTLCDANDCAGGTQGCPVFLYAKSGQRPATATPAAPFPPPAANDEDGKDRSSFTVSGANLELDQTFDLLIPMHATIAALSVDCYLYGYDPHLIDDTADPIEVVAPIAPQIQADGTLAFTLGSISFPNLALSAAGCGELGSAVATAFAAAEPTLEALLIAEIQPSLNAALQAAIPTPAGAAGVFDMTAQLKPYAPPAGVHLELLALAGGYGTVANGGLNVGIIAGMNSDTDETTRTDARASEPSTCVPQAVVPDLSAPPWSLPYDPNQKDYTIPLVDAFSGASDPTVGLEPADILFGVSQAFFGLAAAHAANSGALCLSIGGTNLPALTSGALSVLVDSTGSVYDDRRAALTAVLHPGLAPQVTLGTGSASDPFVHVAFPKLGFDLNVGVPATRVISAMFDADSTFDVGVSPIAADRPGLEPLLITTSVSNLVISSSSSKSITADAQHLTSVLTAMAGVLAEVAAAPFAGPANLPSLPALAVDQVQLSQVQSADGPLLSIAATFAPPTSEVTLHTTATIDSEAIPGESALRALFDPGAPANAPQPSITLKVGPAGAEFSWRVDGSAWRAWSTDTHPTLSDAALLLQGQHTLDVRARNPGDWRSEDLTPAHVSFVVDSVPPELNPALDAKQPALIDFNGFDLVTLDAKLVYAWGDGKGSFTPFASQATLAVKDALAVTHDAAVPLVILAKDEAGNVGRATFSVPDKTASDAGPGDAGGDADSRSAGAQETSGCGCRAAGSSTFPVGVGGAVLGLALLVGLRRMRRGLLAPSPTPGCAVSA